MLDDPFLNRVGLQLVDTPQRSRQVLEAVACGTLPPNVASADLALMQAEGWLSAPFREKYKAPNSTRLVAFPMEEGICDVIRTRYITNGLRIEVAQSAYLLSIAVSGWPIAFGVSALERAAQAARELFNLDAPPRFELLETRGPLSYGLQSSIQSDEVGPHWLHWFDCLRWWCGPSDLGFLTLKVLGDPVQELILPIESANLNWFRRSDISAWQ